MGRIYCYILLLLTVFCFSCSTTEKGNASDLLVMDVEAGVKEFAIKDLSEYASDIRYVKLETDDNCLVTQGIRGIFLEDNKIFVFDNEPYLKVFDAITGKYLYNIGSKGQGPGDLPALTTANVNPHVQRVVLSWSGFRNVFDFEGNFLEKIEMSPIASDPAEGIAPNLTVINENLFAVGFYTPYSPQENSAMVFDREQNVYSVLKSYRDLIFPEGILAYSFGHQSGTFYWSMDEMHYYRLLSDTIYRYEDQSKSLEPYLALNFGKHASKHDHTPGAENKDWISIASLSENMQTLFIQFNTQISSPETFELTVWRSGWYSGLSHSFYAVFDKKREELYCLLQPVKGLRGLNNDIDHGLPFWPKTVTSKNELIDYYHAFQFLEAAEKLTDMKEPFKELIQSIDEEDNPIVIIAKGR